MRIHIAKLIFIFDGKMQIYYMLEAIKSNAFLVRIFKIQELVLVMQKSILFFLRKKSIQASTVLFTVI